MMKIVYSLPYLWNSGGIDRVIAVKANYLAEAYGYDVTIITTNQNGREPFFRLSPKVDIIDLAIPYGEKRGRFGFINTIKNLISHYRRLKETLKRIKPDITISAYRRELPFLYRIKDGSKKIAEQHFCKGFRVINRDSSRLKDGLLGMCERYWISHYDRYIVLTDEEKNLFYRDFKNVIFIHNPVTIDNPTISKLTEKRVIAVGRICYQKAFDRLVEAWSIVEKAHPDWRLDIIGNQDDIAELNKLKGIISLHNLQRVNLIPATKDIAKEYADSSIMVMSSRFEGLPLVLIEASSCGVPVVSFTCKCGPRDIITDGKNGLLVTEGDIEGLANAIVRLIEDEEYRKEMGKEALKNSERFELPAIMNQWNELFKELLK